MLIYLARRLAWLAVVMIGVVTIVFVVARMVPADPARLAAGLNATQEQVDQIRSQIGLDKPVHEQYLIYWQGLARLDFGTSMASHRTVLEDIKTYLPATVELVVVGYFMNILVSLVLGMLQATWPGTSRSFAIRMFTLAGVAMPVYWMGLMLQMVFGGFLGILPVSGRLGMEQTPPPTVTGMYVVDSLVAGNMALFQSSLLHIILPAATWIFTHCAMPSRLMYTSLTDEMAKAYVRTARGKGLPEQRVMFRHVLKNALNPVVTYWALQFGWIWGNTVLIEMVFGWPGIGLYAFQAFQWFDFAPIQALVLIITFIFVVVNILVDLIYPILDPRVKAY